MTKFVISQIFNWPKNGRTIRMFFYDTGYCYVLGLFWLFSVCFGKWKKHVEIVQKFFL